MLNERCRVFLDLAEILSDSVADAKMSYITWIVIILIFISIIVTVTEVGLRFGILSKEKGKWNGRQPDGSGRKPGNVIGGGDGNGVGDRGRVDMLLRRAVEDGNITLDDLRLWSSAMSEKEREAVCGGEIVRKTFAGV